jgi:hypothetical protein
MKDLHRSANPLKGARATYSDLNDQHNQRQSRATALDLARACHARATEDLRVARRDYPPDCEIVRHAESRFVATLEKVSAASAALTSIRRS